MSKTRSRHPAPEDGKDKWNRRRAKPYPSGHRLREQLASEFDRIYQEDFLPPRSWHGDA